MHSGLLKQELLFCQVITELASLGLSAPLYGAFATGLVYGWTAGRSVSPEGTRSYFATKGERPLLFRCLIAMSRNAKVLAPNCSRDAAVARRGVDLRSQGIGSAQCPEEVGITGYSL